MTSSEPDQLAAEIADLAWSTGRTVAVAESLTGGAVASALAAAKGASEWFRGGLVAYSSEVKHEVLGVPDGPVVSAEAAAAMASGVRALLRADVALATTGAGGPDPQDGQEPGTVYLAVDDGTTSAEDAVLRKLDGAPDEIIAGATTAALALLVDRLRLPVAESSGPVGSP